MSLLMDALRKAEEAKKLAAKQAKGTSESGNNAAIPAAPVTEVAPSINLSTESNTEDFSTSHSSSSFTDDLGEAFEFEIDESFGMDVGKDHSLETKSSNSLIKQASIATSETPLSSDAMSSEHSVDFDTSDLSLVEVDKSGEESTPDDAAISESTSGLASSFSLEERTEPTEDNFSEPGEINIDPETSIVEEAKPSAKGNIDLEDRLYLQKEDLERLAPQKSTTELMPELSGEKRPEERKENTKSDSAVKPAFVSAATSPMRALREDADITTNEKRTSDAINRKAGAAIESRKRESARAVFNAKSANMNPAKRAKLMALLALVVLIPLGGVGFWLIDPLGLFSSASQYNVPVASYDPNRSLSDVLEPGAIAADDQTLPDVSNVEDLTTSTVIEELPGNDAGVTAQTVAPEATAQVAVIDSSPGVALDEVSPDSSIPMEQGIQPEAPIQPSVEIVAQEEPTLEAPVASNETTSNASPPSPLEEIATTDTPISIIRSETPQIDPQLSLAFNAFRDDDFVTARAHYQQALRNIPNSRDALLGLAAVSLKIGDANGARAHYTKLLELDPRDPLARVGLLETVPATDSIEREGELRALFNEHPNIPQLAFALGNLQASQGRWNDAQQSYYDALLAAKSSASGAVSPDYAFNLAVSLERLNQLRPAYEFYREALVQSQTISPTFDVRILRERLDAIERALP